MQNLSKLEAKAKEEQKAAINIEINNKLSVLIVRDKGSYFEYSILSEKGITIITKEQAIFILSLL